MSNKLLVVCNDLDFFLLHRLPETSGALKQGYEVHVATPPGARVAEVRDLGFIYHELVLTRSGQNPMAELAALRAMYALFKRVQPDLVYLMTVKPILYGGIAARLAGVKAVVAAVFGMGYLFTDTRLKTRILRTLVSRLYRLALGHRNIRVIFQNPTDRDLMVGLGVVLPENTVLVRGSGVDLQRFAVIPEPEGRPVVLMAARLLYDKGVREYVEAARLLCEQGVDARFVLVGDRDDGNPSSLSRQEVEALRADPNIEFLGFQKDMPQLLAAANIVVLPSYREGLPRVLEEAAACGRAVITTDVPGCRDAIETDVSGLLVPVRDAVALADAIRRLLADGGLRREIGRRGRQLAERRYAVAAIVDAHLAIYRELISETADV
ncbi:glycosyltransferase family 4 protein [Methylomonas sp. EFPC3]|uniref:glycosyltransferase family 4 protein n=1 Tax=Methylomonas sp. EFPC3 TaxID=3021710 RepID=UPI002417AA7D|nr:glycosyltransferase family 4 protein [Methylomonas sp. EFPC3]WFP50654.1 glycosyltransferase family 4 protein [Methylomonas sp. EFPC3]